jgi:GT2 family glycosyltransferase
MSSRPEGSGDTAAPIVVAVVLARDPSLLSEGLDALGRQVYGPFEGIVVGGGPDAKSVSDEFEVPWVATIADAVSSLGPEVTYVWFVDQETRARPDALGALIAEAERVDASVAGSKVLSRDDPQVLTSVGLATDVFDVPYTGIDLGEVDQAQYDVVRDVAAVPAVSLLVRRDLLRGLRGPDRELAPGAGGIDFCQRARLRGARVIVAPSSEVLFPSSASRTASWREEAGRIRAMLKSYSLITLAWALPLAFVIGLIEGLVTPFLGRFTLFIWLRAWAWNLVKLPSTIAARWSARRRRTSGDEELFRYQVSGSAKLRLLFTETLDRVQERLPEGRAGGVAGLIEAGQSTLRSPGFLAAASVVVFGILATRSIWADNLPAVGYSLPPSGNGLNTLGAYAGGWNPAGLGSADPLHPAVGFIAAFQILMFDNPDLTASLLTMAALISGAIGMARLLRSWGLGAPAAYAGGVVLVGGPATWALAQNTEWTALLALGALPWAMRLALRAWPRSWRGRVGRIAGIGMTTALAAAGLPALIVVPTVVLVIWAPLGEGRRWWPILYAALGAALAAATLLPWIGIVDFYDHVEAGSPAFWEPSWLVMGLVGVAAGGVLLAGKRLLAAIAGWGAVLAAGGTLLARLGDAGYGREIEALGLVLTALGSAAITGAAVETARQLDFVSSWRRVLGALAVVAGVGLVASTLLVLVPGRAGLPGDIYREALAFTTLGNDSPQDSRALLLGPAADLPGDSRRFEGAPYRVVAAPVPALWDAELGAPRLGDVELDGVLAAMAEGEVARAGELLVPFGIRWVVVVGPSPLEQLFVGQLDLVPLPGLSGAAFVNETPATRAVASDGTPWTWDGPGYRGPAVPGGRVYVAENADQRWGPDPWAQQNWANEVSADDGAAGFSARQPARREALFAAALFAAMLAAAVLGTGRRAR